MSETGVISAAQRSAGSAPILSVEHLFEHAKELARQLEVTRRSCRANHLFRRVCAGNEEITRTYEQLSASASRGESITGDAEWLLDNFYVVKEQVHEIEEDLPPRYCAELPKLKNGEPRVYQIARELILHTDGLLDEGTIVGFTEAFQQVSPLTIGELWAVPIMLRIGLVECLGRLSGEIRRHRRYCEETSEILKAWPGGSTLPAILRSTDDELLLLHALMALDECSSEDMEKLAPLERLLLDRSPALHDRVREYHQRKAASQISVGNVITAMRLLSALDWIAFFERCSLVEQALRKDPDGTYGKMDYESRDRYRHSLEQISKRSLGTELGIARAAVSAASRVVGDSSVDQRKRHVGYWLIENGRRVLESEFRYRPTVSDRIVRSLEFIGLAGYAGAITAISLSGALTALWLTGGFQTWAAWLIGISAAIALSDFAVGITNYIVTRLLPPRVLPKLALSEGIPVEFRTIVVIPSMLSNAEEIRGLLERLELHHVANADANVGFALLTDFTDADQEVCCEDDNLLDVATSGILRLNSEYGRNGTGPFFLFHRKRQWNPGERCWMGWERKRGKLMEFNRLLRGATHTSYIIQKGDLRSLVSPDIAPVRFVITCDADTQLPFGAARRLIGTLAHALNQPCFDEHNNRVVAGYTLIQPRVGVTLTDSHRSWYGRIMANCRGIDPYASAASDVYHDLFGEGSFTGKGIYDLDAFERCLNGAFGENQILSHDLIEGCHARAGLASDIELIDGFPMRYDADAKRQHRWIRGDWQILPWLLPRVPAEHGERVNPLNWLSRWKILDNLRRSFVAPAIVVTMLAGWSAAPEYAWFWSLFGLVSLATALFVAAVGAMQDLMFARDFSTGLQSGIRDLKTALLQWGILVVSVEHRAVLMIDAIGRTLWRMFVSRRHLLEWQPAAYTERMLKRQRWPLVLQLWYLPASVIAIARTLPAMSLSASGPWLLAWFGAPLILDALSRPRKTRLAPIDSSTRKWLRLMARRNWNYFEDTPGPQNHWLPPDNVQEYPNLRVANRLSPTNEGLFLVAVLAARDFGYIGLHAMAEAWERNLGSLVQLPRVGGHFFNWYDTVSLQPLRPRYLSTVDSGNLAASLLTVRQGIAELRGTPILCPALWDGLTDTISLAEEKLSEVAAKPARRHRIQQMDAAPILQKLRMLSQEEPRDQTDWSRATAVIRDCAGQLAAYLSANPAEQGGSLDFPAATDTELRRVVQWLEAFLRDYDRLYPWIDVLGTLTEFTDQQRSSTNGVHAWSKSAACAPELHRLKSSLSTAGSLVDLVSVAELAASPIAALGDALRRLEDDGAAGAEEGQRWLEDLQHCLRESSIRANELDQRFHSTSACAEKLVEEMDFKPLYDPLRRLFSIGFNLEEGRLDASYYDLLCSEARLSSYIAIAKGDVPVRHWFRLGRQTTCAAGQTGLLSWGGTMFEFLMPLLFQPRLEGTLLSAACKAAVARQREHGRQRNLPWGVSESAFSSLSPNSDYQYQSFGVPGLGLKRGLSKDNVVAPYATLLAIEIEPKAAIRNLRRLEQEGALAHWGFYDSIDYTPARVPEGQRSILVRCFMAHHQGMSFLSLSNLLNQQGIRRRFRAHPRMRAAELLLQEGVPLSSPVMEPHADEVAVAQVARPSENPVYSCRIRTYDTPSPRAHLLSNGSYAVIVTNSGGGYSSWKEISVSRWRSDVTLDCWGQWIYLSDRDAANVWSATYQPTLTRPDEYDVVFSIDKAEFRRRDGQMESLLEVAISPEDAMEVRRLKLTNLGMTDRVLDITSYLEIVLTKAAADLAHPAFQKLFIETEYLPESTALLARRRPRSAEEPALWAVHILCPGEAAIDSVTHESSRVRFLGRGRTTQSPAALDPGASLSGSTGPVLDPIFSIRCRVRVPASSSVQVAFVTGIASTREESLRLANLYHDWRVVQRAFELAWAYNQIELRHWRATAAQTHRFQRLGSMVLYPTAVTRGPKASLVNNRLSQRHLWPFGISGDRPILVVRVDHTRQANFVRELIIAQEFWAYRLLLVDVVILNCMPGSYLDELQEQLERLVRETPRRADVPPGAIYVLRCSQLSNEQILLLEAVAALVLDAARGWVSPASTSSGSTLVPGQLTQLSGVRARQLRRLRNEALSDARTTTSEKRQSEPAGLEFWNGYGGFAAEGLEYHIRATREHMTPMPWSNVIANERFGCLVTESGSGYTWAANSRENKLTSWSNDPVSDPPAEQVYLTNSRTSEIWQLLGGEARAAATLTSLHACGWSRWLWSVPGLQATVTVSVAATDPVKLVEVEVRNESAITQDLTLTYFAEWVLGTCREETHLHLVTEIDSETQALIVSNSYHPEFSDQIVFLRAVGSPASFLGDRCEFLGRNGSAVRPTALAVPGLSGRVGPGLDPCGAVQVVLHVAPHHSITQAFVLGSGSNRAEAMELLRKYKDVSVIRNTRHEAGLEWKGILESVQVKTENRAFDLLTNRWLLYQTLSCRIRGRTGFYQASGAYGFRDQLQDVMALVYSRPDLAREHLIRAAAHQFVEGDVQHWWHPPSGRGTRTRFSDDLLWLVLSACHYVEVTQDQSLWDEDVAFLESPLLAAEEHERYECPQVSAERGSIYEHCLRALRQGYKLGPHGLPLIGCGDWNDGMNKVGEQGRGESIWVGWFLLVILENFIPVMMERGDSRQAIDYLSRKSELLEHLELHGWDGEWYRRAYFDDQSPLGTQTNPECQIDSITQSWAVLAGADSSRTDKALSAVQRRLVRPADNLVALLAPPFDQSSPNPGYIMGYLKGIRENGGQYTHAVLWLIQALTAKGDGDAAMAIFDLINPIHQAATEEDVARYQVEPYVMAADVYSEPPHAGRGGWTWYTGSSAWTYRTALENILGLRLRGAIVSFQPCVPLNWTHFRVSLQFGDSRWHFRVEILDEPSGGEADRQSKPVELTDDGREHEIVVQCHRRDR